MAITNDKGQDGDTIWASSLVSATTKEGVVALTWGEKRCQLSPDEARAFARTVLETAEAADTDAMLVEWSVESGRTFQQSLLLLQDFRKFRAAREPETRQ